MFLFTPQKKDIDRLLQLQNSDRGFFALAVYSFIEAYLRARYNKSYSDEADFYALINTLHEDIKNGAFFNEKLHCLGELKRYRHLVNAVRHEFFQLSHEEVLSIVYRFREFAQLNDFYTPATFANFETSLLTWANRQQPDKNNDELQQALKTITILQHKNTEIEKHLAEFTARNAEFSSAIHELAILKADIKNRNAKIDTLRNEKYQKESELRHKITELEKSISCFEEANTYRRELLRLSCYTRTRFEYEQTLLALTEEQAKVVNSITLNNDFLIEGGAGTGKTLVLIKLLEKCLALPQKHTVFLTFTRSLAAYHKYVSLILGFTLSKDSIATVDSFLVQRFAALTSEQEEITYDDKKLQTAFMLPENCAFSIDDLYDEANNFIWANNINRTEYVDGVIKREGMKLVLEKNERSLVYDIVIQAEQWMHENHTWNRNYAVCYMIRHARDFSDSIKVDYALIDEVQDLPPCVLLFIKLLCRNTVFLAGDTSQSIYRNGFNWERTEIAVENSRHVLHTNFRNSMQIHSLAKHYHKTIDPIQSKNSTAFRLGPPPELFTATNAQILHEKLLIRLQFFLEQLEYEPQNICIIASKSDTLIRISHLITEKLAVPVQNINTQQFDFSSQGIIRLSTMYSGKGLDFPVVFLLFDSIPRTNTAFDRQTQEKLLRNLIYVSITRALEHLHVFCLCDIKSSPIMDLCQLF